MPAQIARRGSRLILILVAAATLGAIVAAPVAAADSTGRPEPSSGGIVTTRVDVEPGGPTPTTAPPSTLNLFRAEGFRFQDPNYYACTATSALVMLNTIALNGNGGSRLPLGPPARHRRGQLDPGVGAVARHARRRQRL